MAVLVSGQFESSVVSGKMRSRFRHRGGGVKEKRGRDAGVKALE
jgi:hypothetical protein